MVRIVVITSIIFYFLILFLLIDRKDMKKDFDRRESELLVEISAYEDEARKQADWDRFVEALIEVESGGQSHAEGDGGNAVGVLQLWEVMVDEANRLLRAREFDYDDRLSRQKSKLIFEVVMRHRNPDRSIERALLIWNPRAGEDYRNKIYDAMRKTNHACHEHF